MKSLLFVLFSAFILMGCTKKDTNSTGGTGGSSPTGIIKYIASGSNTFEIYLDGRDLDSLHGGNTYTAVGVPVGNHTVQAIQTTGSFPVNRTDVETVTDGGTLEFKFP